MRHRILTAIALLTVAAPLVAQGKLPRTADGHPDLQGVWNFSTITPLERPAEFAGKPFLTEEEAKALEERTIERSNRDNRDRSNADADVASPTTSSGGTAAFTPRASTARSTRR